MRKFAWLMFRGLVLFGTLPMFAATTTAKSASSNAATAAPSENLPPAHPVSAAQVHEILELTGTNTAKREMLDGMLPHLKEMMPYIPADVVDDLQRTLGTADFEGAMVRSFQQHMSTEEAAQIIAFYESPAGKHMIAVMPKVLNEGQDAGAQLGQQVMFEVIQRHKDEINAAAKLYHEEHPQNAPQH